MNQNSERNAVIIKPLVIAILIFTLQIPMAYIGGLIHERETSKREATEQVAQMAGGQQLVTTPVLTVWYSTAPNEAGVRAKNQAALLPHTLSVRGNLESSIRSRGIYDVPVYSGKLTIEGEFSTADLDATVIGEGSTLESAAAISIGLADLRGIRNTPQIEWDGAKSEFSPGIAALVPMERGIRAAVLLKSGQERYRFSTVLDLSGSQGFLIRPVAKSSHITLSSNWADPSFVGDFMPTERSVDGKGFTADWELSDLSLGIQTAWIRLPSQISGVIDRTTAGVQLLSPINSHRMSERATKYELLFFFLTFLAFFVYELLADVRIHPIQYLLVGAALTIFYLLILSLSEHIGFTAAYGLATLVSTGLISGYARAILRRAGRTWIIPPLMIGMYGFLYTLLIEEDYALLSGSLGLAAILGALMYITRNVDWFAFGQRKEGEPPADPVPAVSPTAN